MNLPSDFDPDSTVTACATAPGEGGVSIVRLSGKQAFAIADRIFSKSIADIKTHTVSYGQVHSIDKEPIDTILLLKMESPRSFTGEDVIEFHCHGGPLITERVLSELMKAGAKAALPGEFSKRAYLNGKMDLSQAEAIQELIGAKNEYALKAARGHLEGSLSKKIHALMHSLSSLAAILEAWVDFPDEDLEFTSHEQFLSDLDEQTQIIEKLSDSFHDGKKVSDGVHICLLGIPNAGKSSLMNLLLDRNRAIVTDIPGTTRDTLEDTIRLQGLHVRLTDTAGIREADDVIEQEGIRRSWSASDESDLTLLILDASLGLNKEQQALMDQAPKDKSIVIWNKVDLPHDELPKLDLQTAFVSALKEDGIDELKALIRKKIWDRGAPSQEELMITSLRHKEALDLSLNHLDKVKRGLQEDLSPEFISFDMQSALHALGSIIGTDVTEDLLDAIFAKFCLGK